MRPGRGKGPFVTTTHWSYLTLDQHGRLVRVHVADRKINWPVIVSPIMAFLASALIAGFGMLMFTQWVDGLPDPIPACADAVADAGGICQGPLLP